MEVERGWLARESPEGGGGEKKCSLSFHSIELPSVTSRGSLADHCLSF